MPIRNFHARFLKVYLKTVVRAVISVLRPFLKARALFVHTIQKPAERLKKRHTEELYLPKRLSLPVPALPDLKPQRNRQKEAIKQFSAQRTISLAVF